MARIAKRTSPTRLSERSLYASTISDPGDCTDDTWTATSTTNAPAARTVHTAVWTGSEMIVWGGNSGFNAILTPAGDIIPARTVGQPPAPPTRPLPEKRHTAVWTGSEMIVWGGCNATLRQVFNTGGRYNPSTDSWTATSTTNAPADRESHTAVWTGSEMIVWGGCNTATI